MIIKIIPFLIAALVIPAFQAIASSVSVKETNCDKIQISDLSKAVEIIRPSIVQIVFFAFDLSPSLRQKIKKPFISIPIGTGFFLNAEGYVVTANHVIDSGEVLKGSESPIKASTKGLLVGVALPLQENMRAKFQLLEFDIIKRDEQHDLALLKLRGNPFTRNEGSFEIAAPKIRQDRPRDGEPIGLSGYPLNNSVLVTKGGWMATSWNIDVDYERIEGAPQDFIIPVISESYLADIDINPGNSGGPIYSAFDGSIIGVAVAFQKTWVQDEGNNDANLNGHRLFYSSGITVVVPIKYALELLK